jgi:hypothetical protein
LRREAVAAGSGCGGAAKKPVNAVQRARMQSIALAVSTSRHSLAKAVLTIALPKTAEAQPPARKIEV